MPNFAVGYHWDEPAILAKQGVLNRNHERHHVAFKSDIVPDRFELFLLDDGQSKVEHKEETRKNNPSTLLPALTQLNL